jgi:hypothetical protein
VLLKGRTKADVGRFDVEMDDVQSVKQQEGLLQRIFARGNHTLARLALLHCEFNAIHVADQIKT